MIGATSIAAGTFVAGAVATTAVLVAVASAAVRLRGSLVPAFAGAPARLVEAVLGLALVLGTGQLLGALGVLRPGPALVALLGVALVAHVGAAALARRGPQGRPAPIEFPPVRRAEFGIALVAVAVVAAQWSMHVAFALGRGMTHPDTLWYHAPFTTRFVQEGAFRGIAELGYAAARYYPFDSELLHALVVLPFDRDIVSPFLNLGWCALALLAAWCAGRRAGVAPWTTVAGAAACSLPILAGTQPGQASTDIVCATLLLSAVALLLLDARDPAVVAVAGIAAGLAIGTKLNTLLPVATLTIGVIVLAVAARRARTAVAWCSTLVVFGSYWYLRDWATVGSPLPWLDVPFVEPRVPALVKELGATFAGSVRHGDYPWSFYEAGLTQAFGRGWPLVVALALVAVVAAAVRGGAVPRVLAATVAVGVGAYAVTPLTGGLSFGFNLRYLAPTILVAFVLFPIALASDRLVVRVAVGGVLAVALALAATAAHHELVPAWPSGHVLAGVVGIAVALGVVALATKTRPPFSVGAAGVLLVLAAGALWFVQRQYLEDRYVDADLTLDAVNERFADIRDANVAVFGTVEVYPMFGRDLSNVVVQPVGRDDAQDSCRTFARVRQGEYDYVLFTLVGLVSRYEPPREWFEQSANATEVYRDDRSVVYRVDGPLDPPGC